MENDIALVKLSGNGFDMSVPDVRTVCLPVGADDQYYTDGCFVSGWGATGIVLP